MCCMQCLSYDSAAPRLEAHETVQSLGLQHGDMLHLKLDETKVRQQHSSKAMHPKCLYMHERCHY